MTKISKSKADIVKHAFCESLEELMRERELTEISINEIVENAGMSRTTFYRYFRDKYELSIWRLEHIVTDPEYTYGSTDAVASVLKKLILEIGEHKTYYKKLFAYAGQNSLEEFFFTLLHGWSKKGNDKSLEQKDHYIIQYNASGFTGGMKRWLNDRDPIAPEDFSVIMLELALV